MITTNELLSTLEEELTRPAARTFRVWELTAVYRLIGLEPGDARDAAVADLRMFPTEFTQVQEVAA
jgi:hypothetical protein